MTSLFNDPPQVPYESRPVSWWVNQGQTYAKERDGLYIWAPQKTKKGTPASHHTAVADVHRGDRFVHYAKGHIRAVGIALSDGREQRRPDELSGEAWEVDGYSAEVDYRELERPIPLAQIDNALREGGGGPFTSAGAVRQGYLFRVSDDVGQYLATLVDQGGPSTNYVDVVVKFSAAARASGLDYGARHDRLIGSFVTALATKPFAILTGLSGSGKTRLALAFGQWLGDDAVQIIPVRPDWTSPDSLLGYEDALAESSSDGRLRWIVPQALEFMLRAANNPERPYLLVLDEMNLAHVERYFADVLSGMESGQGVLPNLVLEDDGQYRERTDSTGPLPLPDNLFIVGTVNVDETTYMFSPKVLDRANSFEFRVGTGDLGATGALRDLDPTSAEDAAGFLRAARTTPEPSADDEAFEQAVRSLHALLSEYDREFGHRTFQESIRFARRFRELDPNPLVALDLQVIQKVLPRLHGSRRELTAVLNQLGRWCFYGPGESRDPFDAAEQQPVGAVLPESYNKLHRMAKRLRDRHFASFAE